MDLKIAKIVCEILFTFPGFCFGCGGRADHRPLLFSWTLTYREVSLEELKKLLQELFPNDEWFTRDQVLYYPTRSDEERITYIASAACIQSNELLAKLEEFLTRPRQPVPVL